MRFELVDQIVEVEPGSRIVAAKNVSLAEEYLGDHFPTFPILPGVLMLEALVESGAWLVRATENFAHSLILLREARNVTYRSFVKPGSQMRIEVICRKLEDEQSDFSGSGRCGDTEVVKARFGLRHFNLAERSPKLAEVDRRLIQAARARFDLLRGHYRSER
jgi:3-hydroxyacyl-[acyl-carrier-protein] dehydratase